MTEQLLTVTEAAACLRVSPGTVRSWVAQGRFPAGVVLRAGSRIRFRGDQLLRWAEGAGPALPDERGVPVPPRKKGTHLYRRGKVWYLRVQICGKVTRKALSTSYADARMQAKTELARLRAPARQGPATFADAAADWLKGKGKTRRNEASLANAKNYIEAHINEVLGPVPLDSLTNKDLWRLRVRLGEDLAEWTVASAMSVTRAVLIHAKVWRDLTEPGLVPVPKRQPPDRLTDVELEAVIAAAGKWEPYVRLSVLTGIRWGELKALRWNAWQKKPYPHLLLRETKDGGFRRVPVPAAAAQILEGLEKTADPGFVLPFRVKTPPRFRVPGVKWHWHQFRHTFGCRWVESGRSLSALRRIFGHKNIQTTLIYAEPSDASVYREAESVTLAVTNCGAPEAKLAEEVAV